MSIYYIKISALSPPWLIRQPLLPPPSRWHLVRAPYLYPEQQVPVGMLQFLLSGFKFLGTLLFSLQLSNIVHGGFQYGSLVPAHVSVMQTEEGSLCQDGRRTENSCGSTFHF